MRHTLLILTSTKSVFRGFARTLCGFFDKISANFPGLTILRYFQSDRTRKKTSSFSTIRQVVGKNEAKRREPGRWVRMRQNTKAGNENVRAARHLHSANICALLFFEFASNSKHLSGELLQLHTQHSQRILAPLVFLAFLHSSRHKPAQQQQRFLKAQSTSRFRRNRSVCRLRRRCFLSARSTECTTWPLHSRLATSKRFNSRTIVHRISSDSAPRNDENFAGMSLKTQNICWN